MSNASASDRLIRQNEPVKNAQLRGEMGTPRTVGFYARWDKVSRAIENFFCFGVTGTLLSFMMFYMIVQVFSRKLLNKPVPGVIDLVGLSVMVAVFSALAVVQRERRHIRVEVFTSKWNARTAAFIDCVGLTLLLVLSIFLVYGVGRYGVLTAYRQHIVTESIFLPKWPAELFAPVGAALWSNRVTLDLVKRMRELLIM